MKVAESPTRPAPDGLNIPEREAAEADHRCRSFAVELDASSEIEMVFVRHAARMSVRMERCALHATAIDSVRVRLAIAAVEIPEGCTPKEAENLRRDAATLALFCPSAEATLARKYEQAAERGFFRAVKELRIVQRDERARERREQEGHLAEPLGSILPGELSDEEFDRIYAQAMSEGPPRSVVGRVKAPKVGPEVPVATFDRR